MKICSDSSPISYAGCRTACLVALCLWCLPAQCADTVTIKPLGQGVYLRHFHYDALYDSPQELFVVDADLNARGVVLKFPHLTGGARATVSAFAANTAGVVAAVNGQFFDAKGSIQFLKVDGKVVNETQSPGVHDQQAMAVDEQGAISILKRPREGWTSLSSIPNLMSSGVALIENGARVSFDPADTTYSKRHPRTCAAITTDNHLLLVVIDGRSKNAAGQSGEEMQSTLLGLGPIANAFNFDGGGSTTLWAAGAVVNQPSGGTQRPVANALVLLAMPYMARAQSLNLRAVKAGKKHRVQVAIKVVDGGGVPVGGASVIGSFSGAITDSNLNAPTNAAGLAVIEATSATSSGTVAFTIQKISGVNLTWDTRANTSAKIRLPKNFYRR